MKEHEIQDRDLTPTDPAGAMTGPEGPACPECQGVGAMPSGETCPVCEGTGKASNRVGGG